VINIENKNKHVVLIGCDHVYDPAHPQADTIQHHFKKLRPQIAFNEGGQIDDTVKFASAEQGVTEKGESGLLKYLSDRANIKMMNGDMDDRAEFGVMLKKYPKEELLTYYVMERLVIPYLNGAYKPLTFEQLYQKAIIKWFVDEGFPLTEQQRSLSYFKKLYKEYIGHEFKPELNADVELFDYVNGKGCKFCAVGRASKMVRDSTLLTKIDEALKKHDRVIVTFGEGHALAIEPALKQLVAER
jgi:hypothetical protein